MPLDAVNKGQLEGETEAMRKAREATIEIGRAHV